MPINVVRFQVAAYLGLLVGGVVLLMGAPTTEVVSPVTGALITAIIWSLVAWLIHLAGQKRKNWARWTYGILVVFSAISVGFDAWTGLADTPAASLVAIASSALELAAVYYAFTGDAVAWFERRA